MPSGQPKSPTQYAPLPQRAGPKREWQWSKSSRGTLRVERIEAWQRNGQVANRLSAWVRTKTERNMTIWSYAELSSCKTSTQAFSVDVRTQVSRILVSNNWCKCGHAQIQQCKQSQSRGPSHHPTAFWNLLSKCPASRASQRWMDWFRTLHGNYGNYVRWISLLQNRCFQYSLRCKSASERHLGDLCKSLGPLRCNRQICIVVNVRDGSLWIFIPSVYGDVL